MTISAERPGTTPRPAAPPAEAPVVLTDTQIDQLSSDERRQLAARLLGLTPVVFRQDAARRRRRHRLLVILITSCVVMIPWILFLALSLPRHYETGNWQATWVGFDILLLLSLATTAYLGWRGRQLVVLASFATAVLLVCDAWFDISTASGSDRLPAILSAALIELPLATWLARVTYTLMRLVMAQRLGGSGLRALWQLPVLVDRDHLRDVDGADAAEEVRLERAELDRQLDSDDPPTEICWIC